MSRRNKNKHNKRLALDPSHVYFTLPALYIIKDALSLMEQTILLTIKPLPNLDLAEETLGELKIKLANMLQRDEWDKETPLDYNEIHILYASLHMCLVNLTFQRNYILMDQCLTLCKQLTYLVEYADRS